MGGGSGCQIPPLATFFFFRCSIDENKNILAKYYVRSIFIMEKKK